MKKKYLAPILITTLIVFITIATVVGFIGYKVLGQMKQEDLVMKEIDKIDTLLSQENMTSEEELFELLDRKVSKGNYALLEEGIKNHLKDNYLAKTQIEKSLEALNSLPIQSLEDIMKKSDNFKSHIQEVQEIKSNYEKAIENYDYVQSDDWFKDHLLSELKGKPLAMYQEYEKAYASARSELDLKQLEADKAYLTSSLDTYIELITFLDEAKGRYEYKENVLIFNDSNPEVANKDLQTYNAIIDKFQ